MDICIYAPNFLKQAYENIFDNQLIQLLLTQSIVSLLVYYNVIELDLK